MADKKPLAGAVAEPAATADEPAPELDFVGTFGQAQELGNNYVLIKAASLVQAKQLMSATYGRLWAFVYDIAKLDELKQLGMTEVPFGTPNNKCKPQTPPDIPFLDRSIENLTIRQFVQIVMRVAGTGDKELDTMINRSRELDSPKRDETADVKIEDDGTKTYSGVSK